MGFRTRYPVIGNSTAFDFATRSNLCARLPAFPLDEPLKRPPLHFAKVRVFFSTSLNGLSNALSRDWKFDCLRLCDAVKPLRSSSGVSLGRAFEATAVALCQSKGVFQYIF